MAETCKRNVYTYCGASQRNKRKNLKQNMFLATRTTCDGAFQWQSFRLQYGPGVDTASNRNEYQVYFLGVKAAGA